MRRRSAWTATETCDGLPRLRLCRRHLAGGLPGLPRLRSGAGAAADAHGCVRHHLSLRPRAAARAGSSRPPAPPAGAAAWSASSRTIQAKIPAGIDNGQTISIRGQGHAGKNGGPAGDLLITITVRPHELFRREGTSVLCEAPITFAQAVLGAELEIPTIDGKVKYDLPEGTQSGTTFRLKGKGIPELNGRGRGDQYVTVYIETPRNLNREQKEALKKFAESVGDNNYEERKKFFKKFKK